MTSKSLSEHSPIYLDYNASTPVDGRVLEEMVNVYKEGFGNPSSKHVFGQKAREKIAEARNQISGLINCTDNEIIFTSGATESCNLAIKATVNAYREKGNHIITSMAEHKAVLESCKHLANEGFDVTFLKPDSNGQTSAEQIRQSVTGKTILVSIMTANNVLGTINPISQIADLCQEREILFFTDATQALGKIPFDVEELKVDMAAFSSHKIYGPKGVGGLYIRKKRPRIRIQPLLHGGSHERNLRAGTENVAGIAGFGTACWLSKTLLQEETARMKELVDLLERNIASKVNNFHIIARHAQRLPNTTVLAFPGIQAGMLLRNIPEVAASAGAACDSSSEVTNYVLRAIGLEQDIARSAVRLSLGRFTTIQEIEQSAYRISEKVNSLSV